MEKILSDEFTKKIEAIMSMKLEAQKTSFTYTMLMIILMSMVYMIKFFLLLYASKMVNLPTYIFMI